MGDGAGIIRIRESGSRIGEAGRTNRRAANSFSERPYDGEGSRRLKKSLADSLSGRSDTENTSRRDPAVWSHAASMTGNADDGKIEQIIKETVTIQHNASL